jgi:UDP-glucose 4-epimerase
MKDMQCVLDAIEDVDKILHLAANPEVRLSTTEPRVHFNENIMTTFNLLEALRAMNRGQSLVFASSSVVYGEPTDFPTAKKSPLVPVSVYGATKASCEMLIRSYSTLYGIRSASLRYANIVGSRQRRGVIYDFVGKLVKQPTNLEILGDGTQTRSYLHVNDAVNATLTVLNHLEKGSEIHETYNIGNNDWLSVNEIADLVLGTTGLTNLTRSYEPVLKGVGWIGDIKKIALDTGKLQELGFRPSMTSREAVLDATRWTIGELD